MTYRLSRLLSAATASYGAFALARPGHLPDALQADKEDRPGLELLAETYGVRDLAISSRGMFGRSERTGRAAMILRIAMDLGAAALLSPKPADEFRQKVLAVTRGGAGPNTLALVIDSARARR